MEPKCIAMDGVLENAIFQNTAPKTMKAKEFISGKQVKWHSCFTIAIFASWNIHRHNADNSSNNNNNVNNTSIKLTQKKSSSAFCAALQWNCVRIFFPHASHFFFLNSLQCSVYTLFSLTLIYSNDFLEFTECISQTNAHSCIYFNIVWNFIFSVLLALQLANSQLSTKCWTK